MNSIDYRLLNAMGIDTYYSPSGPETSLKIRMIWDQLTNKSLGAPHVVQVAQGRTLMVQKAAKTVAEIDFYELCETAKGSTDYMALAQNYSTIIIRKVPGLSMERRDILRRFILLID